MSGLNVEKLQSRITKVVSSEEALSHVAPFRVNDKVLNGEQKINITSGKRNINNKCVELEILYL